MVVTLGDCESGAQMGERILISEHSLRRIGGGDRVIDRLARMAGGPEVICQSREMRRYVVRVDFLDRCANLGV